MLPAGFRYLSLGWTGDPLLLRSYGYPPLSLSKSSIFAVGS